MTRLFKQVKKFFKKNYFLVFLLILLWATRLPVIVDGVIPFQFDHGKDSLAVLHMWLLRKPKFVGPWTSIPGLYFGPGWYYLLLPFYVLGAGNPVWAVIAMVVVHSILIGLAYRFFGKLAALIFTTAPIWFTITQSAWNPFPMALISLGILVILEQVKKQPKPSLSKTQAFVLGLLAGFGFHFSTAFAIFYPLIIVGSLMALGYFAKTKLLSLKKIGLMVIGFVLPFGPQILFEIKHNFIEIKAVLAYLQNPESIETAKLGLAQVAQISLQEFKQALTPLFLLKNKNLESKINLLMSLLVLLGILAGLGRLWQSKAGSSFKLKIWLTEFIFWILLPIFGLSLLHFNLWYLLAMMPWVVIMTARLIHYLPKPAKLVFVGLLLASSLAKVRYYYLVDKQKLSQEAVFLTAKLAAIKKNRQVAAEKNFSSYHYMPDIYDFPYQYLYFYQALNGQQLPVKFSYQPQTLNYVVQKQDLLRYFENKSLKQSADPDHVFYIVHQAGQKDLLDKWWGRQEYDQIQKEQAITQDLIWHQALP